MYRCPLVLTGKPKLSVPLLLRPQLRQAKNPNDVVFNSGGRTTDDGQYNVIHQTARRQLSGLKRDLREDRSRDLTNVHSSR